MTDLPSLDSDGQREESLSLNQLIWFELKGKNVALARYDSIIWKVRSGYVVVLYGALSLAFVKTQDGNIGSESLLLIWGFSLLCWIVDGTFRFRQLLVVQALNGLMKKALIRTGEQIDEELAQQLLIAGEASSAQGSDGGTKFGMALMRSLFPAVLIYAGTPAVATVYWLIRAG